MLKLRLEVLIQFKKGDHLITLNREGQIYAVGDDTYGQCGYKEDGRNTFAPFAQRRIVTPVKVVMIKLFRMEVNKLSKYLQIIIII